MRLLNVYATAILHILNSHIKNMQLEGLKDPPNTGQ